MALKKKVSPVERAKSQRYLALLEKVDQGKGLSPREQIELEGYDQDYRREKGEGVVIPPGNPVLVSTLEQVGDALGVTRITIQRWKRFPGWPENKPPYDVGVIARWKKGIEGNQAKDEKRDQEINLKREQAKKLARENRIEEGKLIEREATIRSIRDMVLSFREGLQDLDDQLAFEIGKGKNPEERREILERAHSGVCEKLAGMMSEKI